MISPRHTQVKKMAKKSELDTLPRVTVKAVSVKKNLNLRPGGVNLNRICKVVQANF